MKKNPMNEIEDFEIKDFEEVDENKIIFGEGIESPINPKTIWMYKKDICFELSAMNLFRDKDLKLEFKDNGENTGFNIACRKLMAGR